VAKCPSKFCDNENPEGAICCSKCGLDLRLPKKEIEYRDKLYTVFSKLIEELEKEDSKKYADMIKLFNEINMGTFHAFIERNVGTLVFMTVESNRHKKEETTMLDIEKEKLKALKEIRNELKRNKKDNKR